MDIVFAVDSLRRRGISDADILVFVDFATPTPHLDPYGICNVHDVGDLAARLSATREYEYVFATIAGHGTVTGLGLTPPAAARPADLVSAIRSVAGIKLAVLVLGQCFAGIFHLLDATTSPPLIAIGATNLNPSLSLPIQLARPIQQSDGSDGVSGWAANVFMLDLFSWLRAPTDVDGDGALTLIDAYKHAGAVSNQRLREAKAALFMQARHLADTLEKATAGQAPKVVLDAINVKLQRTLENLHVHQEPWVLHATLARGVLF